MLTSTSTNFPAIQIDFKRIELLRKAAQHKTIRVTPEILAKLDEVQTVDELELFITPSTSTIEVEQPAARRQPKRKAEEELRLSSQPEKCAHCGCRMLRVVDPGRPDQRLVLECMRSSCLASVKFTDLPLGTVVGKEQHSLTPKSSYNSLARYYPKNRYTPTPEVRGDTSDAEGDQEQCGKQEKYEMVFESNMRGIFVDVPGQETKARFC